MSPRLPNSGIARVAPVEQTARANLRAKHHETAGDLPLQSSTPLVRRVRRKKQVRVAFNQHGAETIEKVRQTKPGLYLSLVVSLLPRQLSIEHANPLSDLSDEELQRIEEYLAASRAKLVRKLERNGSAAIEVPSMEPIEPVPVALPDP